MNDLKSFVETLGFPAALAAFGGIARACRFGVGSWRHFFASVVVSGFTGVVVHLAICETDITLSMQSAIIAASGYSGGAILDAFVAGFTDMAKNLPFMKGRSPKPSEPWDGVERRKQPRDGE